MPAALPMRRKPPSQEKKCPVPSVSVICPSCSIDLIP
jgi:hypothetical protein